MTTLTERDRNADVVNLLLQAVAGLVRPLSVADRVVACLRDYPDDEPALIAAIERELVAVKAKR